jgi:hypothetical protein
MLQRAQLSLHECQRLAIGNDHWRESLDAMWFLQATLSDLSPVWFDVERWSLPVRPHSDPLSIWQSMAPYANMLRARLEYASFSSQFDDLTHRDVRSSSHQMTLVIRARLQTLLIISSVIIPMLVLRPTSARLDLLYIHAIGTDSLNNGSEALNLIQQACGRLEEILVAIAVLKTPASVNVLAYILGLPQDQVARDVQVLVNVLLLVVEPAWPPLAVDTLRLRHPSVHTFLLDPQRRRHDCPWRAHRDPAERCLRILNQSLRENICNIQNLSLADSAAVNLEEQLEHRVSSALHYASQYALIHLVLAGGPHKDLCHELFTFCNEHLVHWIELLSLQDRLTYGLSQLGSAVKWCQVRALPCSHYLGAERGIQEYTHIPQVLASKNLLHDAYRMLRKYMIPIRSHALQVYHSPVVTMPKCALFESAQYSSLATDELLRLPPAINWGSEIQQSVTGIPRLLSGRASGWSTDLATLEGHDDSVLSVAFSFDGKRIISGSGDHTVRMWDAETGAELHVFRGHRDGACSVAFSHDGKRIVSAPTTAQLASGTRRLALRLACFEGTQIKSTLSRSRLMASGLSLDPATTRFASGIRAPASNFLLWAHILGSHPLHSLPEAIKLSAAVGLVKSLCGIQAMNHLVRTSADRAAAAGF